MGLDALEISLITSLRKCWSKTIVVNIFRAKQLMTHEVYSFLTGNAFQVPCRVG